MAVGDCAPFSIPPVLRFQTWNARADGLTITADIHDLDGPRVAEYGCSRGQRLDSHFPQFLVTHRVG